MKKLQSIKHLEHSNMLAEVQASYKSGVKPSELVHINNSADIYSYLRSVWNPDKIEYVEEFMILLLNRGNKIMGWVKISSGGVAGTVADPKVIFQIALLYNASSIILAHNHPSGNLKPSQADLDLTRRIKSAGQVLDITVLDHLIITSEAYYSFCDKGQMR